MFGLMNQLEQARSEAQRSALSGLMSCGVNNSNPFFGGGLGSASSSYRNNIGRDIGFGGVVAEKKLFFLPALRKEIDNWIKI